MACTVAALEFAHRRLASIAVLSGLEAAEVYDRMFERLRHALLLVHSYAPRDDAATLLPLLDLMTSLQVDSMEPVGTGVIAQQGNGLAMAGAAMDKEVTVILSSKVPLAIILPLQEGPETLAVAALTRLLRTVGQEALLAGEPSNRALALEELDREVLAKTTMGPYESSLLVWCRLCAQWEVPAFPLDERNVRAVAASLKRGRYRSSEQYFSAAASFQVRRLHLAVPSHVRAIIRDCIRSVHRGLGPSALKDSFDLRALSSAVVEGSEFQAFSWSDLPSAVDALLVAAYFCMREIEMASASSSHLYFQHGQLHMLLPAHKSASHCALGTPVPGISSALRFSRLVWTLAGCRFFPDDRGKALSKSDKIAAIRDTLRRAGVQTTRQDEAGLQVERFTGHVLRVAGTQHLYLLGLRFDMVQLHGRWSSLAIQKYLQAAPLLLVPGTVARALSSGQPTEPARVERQPMIVDSSASSRAPQAAAEQAQPAVQSCLPARGDSDLAALRLQFSDFRDRQSQERTLIVNARSKRAHLPDDGEASNRPELWATACGILYGNTRFFRTSSSRPEWPRCKRCFPAQGQGSSAHEDAEDLGLPVTSPLRVPGIMIVAGEQVLALPRVGGGIHGWRWSPVIAERVGEMHLTGETVATSAKRGLVGAWCQLGLSAQLLFAVREGLCHSSFACSVLIVGDSQIFGSELEPGFGCASRMDLEAVADAAGAGTEVRKYLKLRGVTSAGTLAMLAPDEATYRDIVIAPLLSGFGEGADKIELSDTDRPIAAAVLLFMRKLAVDSHSGTQASPSPGAATLPTSSGPSGLSSSAKDSDKVPRTLPPGVWTEQIQKFEAVQIHGRHRVFPQQRLLGAESSLAKLWHQLKVTRDFSPLPLGEIMSRRSFDATGAVNALSKRKLSKELIVDVDRDRLVAEDAEDSWEPRSMLAVIDALEASRWAYILLEFGHEFDVCALFDDFIHKARQRPQQLDSFRSYYESASWKLCRELRAGRTFAEAVSAVREDLHLFQEVMSRPPPTQGKASGGKGDPNKKRKQFDESPKKDEDKRLGEVAEVAATILGIRELRDPWHNGVSRIAWATDLASIGQFGLLVAARGGSDSSSPTLPSSVIHLDFFSGVGSASLAIQRLGVSIRHVMSWEIDEAAMSVARKCTRRTTKSQRGSLLDDTPAAVAEAIEKIPGGAADLIVITSAAPCPDFSRIRSDGAPGRAGPSGNLFVRFTVFLQSLLNLLPGRRACLLAENVVMHNPADTQWFSKQLDAEAVLADALARFIGHASGGRGPTGLRPAIILARLRR
ncbi:hypothetical protein AK812_SmicGene42098 [Symbiodinium microadriaticum]|uniref:Uncharacterized protein n=1 Tax=Symbiodinium microadriaticum TaxID=2951 RepID=A0A1Q9C4F5_SYMMI|nr:hypothetical protein AK812_SmicGene42098 [Symbiodinium microadriaticum]